MRNWDCKWKQWQPRPWPVCIWVWEIIRAINSVMVNIKFLAFVTTAMFFQKVIFTREKFWTVSVFPWLLVVWITEATTERVKGGRMWIVIWKGCWLVWIALVALVGGCALEVENCEGAEDWSRCWCLAMCLVVKSTMRLRSAVISSSSCETSESQSSKTVIEVIHSLLV